MTRFVPVFCFWGCVACAVGMGTLVWRAPLTAAEDACPRWLQLYANDVTLRRVTLASAVGLLATAAVFFRWRPVHFGQVRRPDGSHPEVTDAAGA